MKILINAFKLMLNTFYCFFKTLPTDKNKIVFISRQTNNPSLDFRLIIKKLSEQDNLKIVTLTKRIEKNIFDMTIKNFPMMVRQMYHLATAKVCITDGYNLTVSTLKHKKSLKIIQLWHSMTAIKKFGHQTLYKKRDQEIAKYLNMHKNYNYIISGSEIMKQNFAEAFGYSKNKIISLGLPRIDYLNNNSKANREIIYAKYPELKNKKIIMYAPTFRPSNKYQFQKLINKIDLNKYVLIIRKHPNIKCEIPIHKNVYELNEFGSLQILSVANYLITDYSAIILEGAILNIKTFLWIYDYENYSKNPGLNIDIKKEFEKYAFDNINNLYEVLDKEKYDFKQIKNFHKKYGFNKQQNYTDLITSFIMEVKNYEKENIRLSEKTSLYNEFDSQSEISFR